MQLLRNSASGAAPSQRLLPLTIKDRTHADWHQAVAQRREHGPRRCLAVLRLAATDRARHSAELATASPCLEGQELLSAVIPLSVCRSSHSGPCLTPRGCDQQRAPVHRQIGGIGRCRHISRNRAACRSVARQNLSATARLSHEPCPHFPKASALLFCAGSRKKRTNSSRALVFFATADSTGYLMHPWSCRN